MDFAQIQEFFENRLSYKPKTFFSVIRNNSDDFIQIILHARVPDAENPEIEADIISSYWKTESELHTCSEEHCLVIAKSLILEHETHEMDEFFKIDGEYVKHPHPNLCK